MRRCVCTTLFLLQIFRTFWFAVRHFCHGLQDVRYSCRGRFGLHDVFFFADFLDVPVYTFPLLQIFGCFSLHDVIFVAEFLEFQFARSFVADFSDASVCTTLFLPSSPSLRMRRTSGLWLTPGQPTTCDPTTQGRLPSHVRARQKEGDPKNLDSVEFTPTTAPEFSTTQSILSSSGPVPGRHHHAKAVASTGYRIRLSALSPRRACSGGQVGMHRAKLVYASCKN